MHWVLLVALHVLGESMAFGYYLKDGYFLVTFSSVTATLTPFCFSLVLLDIWYP